jgi:UPF0755 protein
MSVPTRRRRLLAAGFLLVLFAAAAAWLHVLVRVESWADFDAPVYVEIPRGASSLKIGQMLAQAGVIRHPLLFLAARIARPWAKPQAGEYEFTVPSTVWDVLGRIARGDVYLVELRVPEGSNAFDVARIVARSGLAPESEMLKLALAQEGYLFPSTYHLPRRTGAEGIRQAMHHQFDRIWKDLGGTDQQLSTVVTLASLVEREAVKDEERPTIAGVYANRLKKGMLLEADPTVEYAAQLDGKWRGAIYKTDLESKNRYNTYRYPGLPPGPVANPGLASLSAALQPAETRALYFVAQPGATGYHVFSETYEKHQKAVADYRRGEQPKAAPKRAGRVAPKPRRR